MKRVAKALIMDSNGNILVLNRGLTHPNFPGHLDFPGGEVEKYEHPLTAVIREIKEETGLAVTPEVCKLLFSKMQDTLTQHLLFGVRITDTSPKITLSWEHIRYEWISQSNLAAIELQDNFDSYYVNVIRYLQDKPL